jgi:hypothetical protein
MCSSSEQRRSHTHEFRYLATTTVHDQVGDFELINDVEHHVASYATSCLQVMQTHPWPKHQWRTIGSH